MTGWLKAADNFRLRWACRPTRPPGFAIGGIQEVYDLSRTITTVAQDRPMIVPVHPRSWQAAQANLVSGMQWLQTRPSFRKSFGTESGALRQLLKSGLGALGKTLGSVRPMRCNYPPKQALAWLIKRNTMAGDEWISRELDMGHRSTVSAFRSESLRALKRLKPQTDIGN